MNVMCSACGGWTTVDPEYAKRNMVFCWDCQKLLTIFPEDKEDKKLSSQHSQSGTAESPNGKDNVVIKPQVAGSTPAGSIKRPKGFRHECGHFCSHGNKKHCCRCQSPKNGYYWPHYFSICRICKGVMRKYVDGFYFQKCPVCGKVVKSTNKGTPILAPLAACGEKCSIERGIPLKKQLKKN